MTETNREHDPVVHEHSITVDGKTIDIYIIEDVDRGGWILEVVDEFWNSTAWDDPFPTVQDAMNQVHETIKDEGIESLIGAPHKPT